MLNKNMVLMTSILVIICTSYSYASCMNIEVNRRLVNVKLIGDNYFNNMNFNDYNINISEFEELRSRYVIIKSLSEYPKTKTNIYNIGQIPDKVDINPLNDITIHGNKKNIKDLFIHIPLIEGKLRGEIDQIDMSHVSKNYYKDVICIDEGIKIQDLPSELFDEFLNHGFYICLHVDGYLPAVYEVVKSGNTFRINQPVKLEKIRFDTYVKSTKRDVTIYWENVPDSTELYHFVISENPSFSESFIEKTVPSDYPAITDSIVFTRERFEPGKDYYWKVEYDGRQARCRGDSSFFFRQQLERFSLVGPDGSEFRENDNPVFEWEKSRDYDVTYELQVCPDTAFRGDNVYRRKDIKESRFSLRTPYDVTRGAELEKPKKYYWKVRAVSEDGQMIESANIMSFTVHPGNRPPGPFAIHAPVDTTFERGDKIYFRWGQSEDPDEGDNVSYDIQISDDSDFPERSVERIGDISNPNYKMDHIYNFMDENDFEYGKDIFWRVVASDSKGSKIISLSKSFKIRKTEYEVPDAPMYVQYMHHARETGTAYSANPGLNGDFSQLNLINFMDLKTSIGFLVLRGNLNLLSFHKVDNTARSVFGFGTEPEITFSIVDEHLIEPEIYFTYSYSSFGTGVGDKNYNIIESKAGIRIKNRHISLHGALLNADLPYKDRFGFLKAFDENGFELGGEIFINLGSLRTSIGSSYTNISDKDIEDYSFWLNFGYN